MCWAGVAELESIIAGRVCRLKALPCRQVAPCLAKFGAIACVMQPVALGPCTRCHLRVLSLAGLHNLGGRAAYSVSRAYAATLDAPSAPSFVDLRLGEGLLSALNDQRLQQPTEIQAGVS